MVSWVDRHPELAWAFAWGVTGSGLLFADVWSAPRRGSLWVGIVPGVLAWGWAGGVTFGVGRMLARVVIWGSAYGLAFWLGAVWGAWFEHNRVGVVASAGFVGALLGWGVGAAAGALATAFLVCSRQESVPALAFAFAWGLSFLVAGYVALVGGVILGEVSKVVLGFLGSPQLALAIGWGLGGATGGLLASAAGFGAWRGLLRSS